MHDCKSRNALRFDDSWYGLRVLPISVQSLQSSTYLWIIIHIREQATLQGYFTYSSLEALPTIHIPS